MFLLSPNPRPPYGIWKIDEHPVHHFSFASETKMTGISMLVLLALGKTITGAVC